MYSKFFDNQGALPHHIHHRDEHAALTGQQGKPEAYYFPPQANNHGGDFPYTFFGLNPGTTRDAGAAVPRELHRRATTRSPTCPRPTAWSRAPAGTCRRACSTPRAACAPTSRRRPRTSSPCTSRSIGDQIVPEELLWKDTPEDRMGDVDWLMEVIDWDLNVDPDFAEKRFMRPQPVRPVERDGGRGLRRELDLLQLRRLQRQGAHRPAGTNGHRSRTAAPTA